MIVVDTDVLSEMMRDIPDLLVKRWMISQFPAALFTTAICEAEILYGVALLPGGRRRNVLSKAAEAIFGEFSGRILPFDSATAKAFAEIAAERRRIGRPIGESDAQIAAIARVHGAGVATRNVSDFAGCGIEVFSPWDAL